MGHLVHGRKVPELALIFVYDFNFVHWWIELEAGRVR